MWLEFELKKNLFTIKQKLFLLTQNIFQFGHHLMN
jgi:hypothetical protein